MRKFFALLLSVVIFCGMLSGCANASQTYANYVQAVMDCTYHGDTAQYIALTGATQQEAYRIYNAEVESVATLICQKFDVDMECLFPETYDEYIVFAQKLLKSIDYRVESNVKLNDTYQATLSTQPPDFWDVAFTYVENAYISEFLQRFAKIDETDPTQYGATMSAWGIKVLEVLNQHFSEVTAQDTKYLTIQIQADTQGRYNVSKQKWHTVDKFLLGLE